MQFNKSLLGQAQSMMQKVQKEMAQTKFQGTAANGKVTIECNGLQEILSVKIDPELLKEDHQILEDLVLVAINDALNKSKEGANNAIAKLMGNFNLPF